MPFGPGAANPSGFPGFNVSYGIVARAGGGAALATPLTAYLNVVTVVATAADSVMLPPGYGGEIVWVINHGGAACTVFGFTSTVFGDVVTDTIAAHNSATQLATGISIPTLTSGVFTCMIGQGGQTNFISPAQWKSILLA